MEPMHLMNWILVFHQKNARQAQELADSFRKARLLRARALAHTHTHTEVFRDWTVP